MITKLKLSLLILISIISCKNQKDEKETLKANLKDSIDSKFLLNKDAEKLNLSNLEGKWELKKSSNTSSENSDFNNFELINGEFILGNENCNSYFEMDTIHNLEYHIEGHFYKHTLKEEMGILDKKIFNLFKIKLNTFKGAISTKCNPPFHTLYVFGENLIVWYSGNYMLFTKNNTKQKLLFECKENNNGKSRYDDPLNKTCICNKNTFEDAYEIFYNESPDYLKTELIKKLPLKNHKHKTENADVDYNWVLKDTLKIDMFFQGGENHYVFYKNRDNKIAYKEYLNLP